MACGITYKSDGTIESVVQENGKPSKLYSKALEVYGDEESAKNIFLVAQTPSFKNDVEQPDKKKYQYSILQKLNLLKPKVETFKVGDKEVNVKDVTYKSAEVKGFTTIQQFANGVMIGRLRMKPYQDGLQVDSVTVTAQGTKGIGLGTELYKEAIRYNLRKDMPFYSDAKQTDDAKRVWEKITVAKEVDGRFKVDNKPYEEPSVAKVSDYVEKNNYPSELTKADIQETQLIMLANGIEDSDQLIDKMKKALFTDGVFKPTLNSLKSFYTTLEAKNILADPSSIKEFYYKLLNTDSFSSLNEADKKFITSDNMSIGASGKIKTNNPFVAQEKFREEFGGIKDEVTFKNTVSNSEFAYLQPHLDELFEQYSKLNRIEVVDANMQSVPNNDTEAFLSVTLKEDKGNKVSDYIDKILNLDDSLWNIHRKEIDLMLNHLENLATDISLDLKDLNSKSKEDINILLSSLQNALNTSELSDFAKVYDEIYSTDVSPKAAVITDNRKIVKIEGDVNEFEMFREHGVIPLGDQLYLKTNAKDVTVEEAAQITGITDLNEVKNINLIDVKDVDLDDLKKYAIFVNSFSKAKYEDTTVQPKVEGETYSDIYQKYLKSKDATVWKYVRFTPHGLELISNDMLSTEATKELFPKEEENLSPTFEQQREELVKNPKSIEIYKGEYYRIDNDQIQADFAENFIRLSDGVYENVNNNVYTKLSLSEPAQNYSYPYNGNTRVEENTSNLYNKKEADSILPC